MPTTRFAPSPTGALHLGHVHAALFARRLAGPDGRFLLRMEDLDPVRCRPEHATAIEADLAWLGLDWPRPVRRQSAHLPEYRDVLDTLAERGLLYPCFCTRAAVARGIAASQAALRAGCPMPADVAFSRHARPAQPDILGLVHPAPPDILGLVSPAALDGGTLPDHMVVEVVPRATASSPDLHAPHEAEAVYPGTCRDLDPGERRDRIARGDLHAWRFDMDAALRTLSRPLTRSEHGADGACTTLPCNPARFGDVVLGRRDVPASYHLCVTHDDALQGVTLVTRAEDLRPASDLHRLLQSLLGWPEPTYAHHPLLRDAQGRRLSKRDGAPTIAALRAQGASPDAVRVMAGGE